ncbi:MAG: chaperone NapD [Gammaproteobacteria bacterium]|jgi:nitrate reductase NapD|nr:chaperone NapD [Gammaproteobacteria bacterium]MBT3725421.1 chaperone NapD [Gammaproteobacteria bacterium]MBT4077839.1 chaperone NapD [Gammaproteobacteria bacterium]MBT4196514.1 chaperone NapD [Gammaproteobacteria bacterium]MBT4450200.1 chaperone NapD [Gammaproteobacteria bacterium]
MSDYNICGVVIHATAEKKAAIEKALANTDGVEVHANTEQGKLVVTVESDDNYYVADIIESFKDIDGVLTASMIYQFCDKPNTTNQGMPA